jgi:hypothetical protein
MGGNMSAPLKGNTAVSGTDINNLNSMINLANDRLTCDSECQRKRKADNYKKKWELAKKNYEQAPEEIKQAEKNYYVYDKGYSAYEDMLYDRYTKSASEFKEKSLIKHTELDDELNNLINNYESGSLYLSRMNQLMSIKLKENDKFKRDIDKYIGFTQTSGRKVVYEDRQRDTLSTYRKIILFIYFLMVTIYIVFGTFIPSKEYKNWKTLLVLILYIIFPFFILDKLMVLIYNMYNGIKSFSFRKDVYPEL